MNNKIYLMTALMAFASVGALLIHPTLAAAAPNSVFNGASSSSSNNTADIATASLSCGQVIKDSVKLSANLDCKSDGLIVGADGITIDLNGHTLAGPGPDSSKIGIMLATSSGVTITGPGTISGFQAGILNTGGQDNQIGRVIFQNNQIAIFNTGAKNTDIEQNMMFNNAIAMASHSSQGTTFSKNLLESNNLAGVTLVNSAGNKIDTNIIQGSNNGVFVDGQSTNNQIDTNTIMKNTGVDVNNANGLPININRNSFTSNDCNTSVPDGLCIASK
ncbi:MAG TPA: right-handed parallel beta-helix repeat-containing protein [Candidatus Sulfopaludibacter sp.]|jgi:parallel beta-helix repeat protein|nr:right-handed parallel beta-helix repeat-containing protein [Candidatus Sulfopaludibacter sp.]